MAIIRFSTCTYGLQKFMFWTNNSWLYTCMNTIYWWYISLWHISVPHILNKFWVWCCGPCWVSVQLFAYMPFTQNSKGRKLLVQKIHLRLIAGASRTQNTNLAFRGFYNSQVEWSLHKIVYFLGKPLWSIWKSQKEVYHISRIIEWKAARLFTSGNR